MSGRLEGKRALVTGAAGGVGAALVARFANEGADVVAIDLADSSLLDESRRRAEAAGRRIVPAFVDVRDLVALTAAVDEGVARLGGLEVVCINAAVFAVGGTLVELSPQEWDRVIGVNLTGAWNTVRSAVPHIVAGGRGGSVVFTGSTASLRGAPRTGAYAAAKHGLLGLMKTLALELAPQSIRANIVHPTSVKTPLILNDEFMRTRRPDLDAPDVDDLAQAMKEINALPTPWLDPEDVASAVLFLASDEARFVTGAELAVDAGNTLN